MKVIDVIEAPLGMGAGKYGSENAYQALQIKQNFPMVHCVKQEEEIRQEETLGHVKNVPTVFNGIKKIQKNIHQSLLFNHPFILLGGDHSLAMASLHEIAKKIPVDDIVVIYIDAHADINTEHTSPSGNIHGMSLAACLNLCKDELQPLSKKCFKGENLYYFGLRSVDPLEHQILQEQQATIYSVEDLKTVNLDALFSNLKETLQHKYIHISFDVDCMDPTCFFATGCLEENGFSVKEVEILLNKLFEYLPIQSVDFVEYNPSLDENEVCKNICLQLLSIFIHHLQKNEKSF